LRSRKARKRFFFEKSLAGCEAKDFWSCGRWRGRRFRMSWMPAFAGMTELATARPQPAVNKSFLLLFFKKEALALLKE
jgi:hypothetical protein